MRYVELQRRVGEKIQSVRKEYGETQVEFATKLKSSQKHISSWENGLIIPNTKKLILLSNAYNVSLDWLFDIKIQE